ncbi:meprin A subunit beta-like [Actinia tenebrosa]|uniref:Metalloendopeptidase n=1 Tax=Actinia tenebrosa TaxID=6105 RepID=A0A6P8J5J0_ACTTE|nr:meprin A subunit beta-like [Actinia tenebrosa]
MGLQTVAFLAALVVATLTLASGKPPFPKPSSEVFDDLLARKIQENAKRGGNVHGHIVAVNDASRLIKSQDSDDDIPLTEDIEEANEEANVDLFEGDILLPDDEDKEEEDDMSQSEGSKRNIIKNKNRLWSTVVPYYVSPKLGYMNAKIKQAVNELQTKTCVRFKKVSSGYNGDHIRLVKGRGCSSSVGRQGGGQKLNLGAGCNYAGVVIHEIMHSLGVWHEQSRQDRDKYVEVLWNNIKRGRSKNFRKYSHGMLDTLNLPYDTSSIMHYDRFLFSIDPGRKPTIIARGMPWKKLGGQLRGTLTANDVSEINSLFKCT